MRQGRIVIALEFELGQGQQPLGRAGMAGDENEVAILRAGRIEMHGIDERDRPAVAIEAQQRHVERIAREVEIVRIAAEERRLHLRREGDADIVIAVIGVEPVLPAAIEVHHFAAFQGALAAAFLFDCCDLGSTPQADIGRRHVRGRLADPVGDVGDRLQDRGLSARADLFVPACVGERSRPGDGRCRGWKGRSRSQRRSDDW